MYKYKLVYFTKAFDDQQKFISFSSCRLHLQRLWKKAYIWLLNNGNSTVRRLYRSTIVMMRSHLALSSCCCWIWWHRWCCQLHLLTGFMTIALPSSYIAAHDHSNTQTHAYTYICVYTPVCMFQCLQLILHCIVCNRQPDAVSKAQWPLTKRLVSYVCIYVISFIITVYCVCIAKKKDCCIVI